MKQRIYVDILVCINLFINYFLLLATAKFLKLNINRFRLIFSASIGAIYSLYILVPRVHPLLSFFLKFVVSILMVITAFKISSLRQFIKAFACFYLMNFIFGGSMFIIWYFISPKNFSFKNGIAYFNISPLLLLLTTTLTYIITRSIYRITGREMPNDLFCDVIILNMGHEKKVKAKIDTGNTLKEPFSQLPVLIVERNFIEKLIPPPDDIDKKQRIVPFHSVSGDGLLMSFKPDKTTIFTHDKSFNKDIYIAPCDHGILPAEFQALASLEIIEE